MNILLIGERYSPNLGDGVIYNCVENICKNIYGKDVNCICFDISGGTSYKNESRSVNLKEKIKFKFPRIRKLLSEKKRIMTIKKRLDLIKFSEIDGAIFVGGQLLSEYFSKSIYVITKRLNDYNIPIVFNCCGLGKNTKLKYINYIKFALNSSNVKAISIRDNLDEFIKKYNLKGSNPEVIMDPVVECSKFYKVNKNNEKIVGIGVMDPKLYIKNGFLYSDEYYFNLYKRIIDVLENKNINWEFFCNGRINDYNYAKKICNALDISYRKISRRPLLPEDLINLITKYRYIISFRLHSHIIAYSYNIPTIGFCWDKKLDFFGKSTNRTEYFLKLDDNIIENFEKTINKLLNDDQNKESIYRYCSDFLKENRFR